MRKYSIYLLLFCFCINWNCEKEAFVVEEESREIPTILKPVTKSINHIDHSEILEVDSVSVTLQNNPELDTLKVGDILFHYPDAHPLLAKGILRKITQIETDGNTKKFIGEPAKIADAFSSYYHLSSLSIGKNRSVCTAPPNNEEQYYSVEDAIPKSVTFSRLYKKGKFCAKLTVKGTYQGCVITEHLYEEDNMNSPIITTTQKNSVWSLEVNQITLSSEAITSKVSLPTARKPFEEVGFARRLVQAQVGPVPVTLGVGGRIFSSLSGALSFPKAFTVTYTSKEDQIFTAEGDTGEIPIFEKLTSNEFDISSDLLDLDPEDFNITVSLLGGIGIEFLLGIGVLETAALIAPEFQLIAKAGIKTNVAESKLVFEYGIGISGSFYTTTLLQFRLDKLESFLKDKFRGRTGTKETALKNYGVSAYFKLGGGDIPLGGFCPLTYNFIKSDPLIIDVGNTIQQIFTFNLNYSGQDNISHYTLKSKQGEINSHNPEQEYLINTDYTLAIKNQLSVLSFTVYNATTGESCLQSATVFPIAVDRTCDSLIKDERPGAGNREYCIAQFGDKLWMTEDLDYSGANNNIGIEAIYGRHYTYDEMRNKNICPEGFQVPIISDFNSVVNARGGLNDPNIFEKLLGAGWTFSPFDANGFYLDASGYTILENTSAPRTVYSDGLYNIGALGTLSTEDLDYSFDAFRLNEETQTVGKIPAIKSGAAVACRCFKQME